MSYFNGWLIVLIPSSPYPVSFEWNHVYQNASNTNPFTGQQQVVQWNTTGYYEGSVQMPPMNSTNGAAWQTFLESCQGIANVFTFPSTMITAYPDWIAPLTTDGTTPRYFRLTTDKANWKVGIGDIYNFVFEVRSAI